MQTFLIPVGSVISNKNDDTEFSVVGYTVYGGDIFHVLVDEYMQETDQYISNDNYWKIVRTL